MHYGAGVCVAVLVGIIYCRYITSYIGFNGVALFMSVLVYFSISLTTVTRSDADVIGDDIEGNIVGFLFRFIVDIGIYSIVLPFC